MNMRLTIFYALLFAIAIAIASRKKGGERKISPVTDEQYEILIKIVSKVFDTPCAQRTTTERNAIAKVRRWRLEKPDDPDHLRVGRSGTTLYLGGRKVLRKSDVEKVFRKAVDKSSFLLHLQLIFITTTFVVEK